MHHHDLLKPFNIFRLYVVAYFIERRVLQIVQCCRYRCQCYRSFAKTNKLSRCLGNELSFSPGLYRENGTVWSKIDQPERSLVQCTSFFMRACK